MNALVSEMDSASSDSRSETVNITPWLERITLDIIGAAGFGVDFGAINQPNSQLMHNYVKAFGGWKVFILCALLLPEFCLPYIPGTVGTALKAGKYIRAHCAQIVFQKRKMFEEARGDENGLGKTAGVDIIGVLMTKGGFTDRELTDQAMTFIGAGHETVSVALAWAIFVLSQPRYQHIQQRLREEIRSNLPNPITSGSSITAERLESLRYLNSVSNEVLRLYGPAPWSSKRVLRDTVLAGSRLPKSTYVTVSPWIINRSRSLWGPDSEEFKPERWLIVDKRDGGYGKAFNTFSAGSRACPGEEFARAEFKAVLAGLVGNFEMTSDLDRDAKDVDIAFMLTAKIKGGVHTKLTVLSGWK